VCVFRDIFFLPVRLNQISRSGFQNSICVRWRHYADGNVFRGCRTNVVFLTLYYIFIIRHPFFFIRYLIKNRHVNLVPICQIVYVGNRLANRLAPNCVKQLIQLRPHIGRRDEYLYGRCTRHNCQTTMFCCFCF